MSPYGAAKAAVVSLTKTLAIEWGGAGVRVNALCPGWTATDLNRTLWEDPVTGPATVAVIGDEAVGARRGDGRPCACSWPATRHRS